MKMSTTRIEKGIAMKGLSSQHLVIDSFGLD
jgi:hypothetical protein